MEPPLVSIIVPFFNEEECLAYCLDSLLRMDYPTSRREIIVVDNNSTDSSARIAQSYPVHYIFEPTPGPSAARNRGAKVAGGEILAFIDADCLVDENWLQEIVQAFARNEVDAVMGLREGINRNIWAEFRERQHQIFLTKAKEGAEDLHEATTDNLAIRKKVFIENGGFEESFTRAQDTDFSIRLHSRGHKMILAPRARVKHVNPTDLQEIVGVRSKQGFFIYKMAQPYDHDQRKKYFPEFSRWYYQLILPESRCSRRLVLDLLAASFRVLIAMLVMLLESLRLLGFRQGLYPLFCFTVDLSFLRGKILARLSESTNHPYPQN